MKTRFLLLLFLISTGLFGQNIPNTPYPVPSPNAASLGLYGEIPVNFSNGVPNISIPIHQIDVDGVSVPINLLYHPEAIAVESHPSWTGLGWTLQAGGTITRVIKGEPDDYLNPDVAGFGGYYYRGLMLDVPHWNNPFYLASIGNFSGQFIDDGQPDVYYFNFGKYSGSFFLNEKSQWCLKTEGNANFTISVQINSGGYNYYQYDKGFPNGQYITLYNFFQGFTIKAEDGTKYVFGGDETAIEFTRDQYSNFSVTQGGYYPFVTPVSWYLKQIITPTGKVVDFTYERGGPLFKKYISYQSESEDFVTGGSPTHYELSNQQAPGGSAINPVYLTKITTPETIVDFSRSQSEQLKCDDLPGEGTNFSNGTNTLLLQYADLLSARNVLNIHDYSLPDFSQELDLVTIRDYKNTIIKKYGFNYSHDTSIRLRLDNVQMLDANGNEIGKYTFDYDNFTALPRYRSFKVDHWGYYNGTDYTSSLTNFYQFDGWRQVNASLATTGVLTKITYPTGGYSQFEFEPHQYSQKVDFPAIGLINTGNQLAGGLRIKKITSQANFNATPVVKQYYYTGNYSSGGTISSGILAGYPIYTSRVVVYRNCMPINGNTGLVALKFNSNNPMFPMSQVNGSSVLYSEVTERLGDGSFTTYKYSNFDTYGASDIEEDGYYSDADTNNIRYRTSGDIERGKLLNVSYYNIGGQKVKEVINEYQSDANSSTMFAKCVVQKGVSSYLDNILNADLWTLPCTYISGKFSAYAFRYYYYRKLLKKTTQIEYLPGSSVSKTFEYSYDNYHNVISAKRSASDNTYLVDETKYNWNQSYLPAAVNNDYDSYSLQNLLYKGCTAIPIEKTTKKTDVNGNPTVVISGAVNKYFSDKAVIKQWYNLDISAPIPVSNFIPSYMDANGGGLKIDTRYVLKAITDKLNDQNDIIQETILNRTTAYTKDYNANYMTSQTKNASYDEVAFTSFEGDYSSSGTDYNKGNWDYSTSNISGTYAMTGSKSYNMNGGGLWTTTSLQVGKRYTVSLWLKDGGSVGINDGINQVWPQTGYSANGWTYYEVTFTATAANIGVWGSGYIDELRLFPADAQMESYTYNPMKGVTSHSDAKGYITFYEYDTFGRLLLVKDLSGMIVKKYEYNIQKPE